MEESCYQEYREWEVLGDEIITGLVFQNGFYNLGKDCVIKFHRDNQFKLSATISGIVQSDTQLEPNSAGRKGTFILTETVIGRSVDGLFEYHLTGIAIGNTSLAPASINPPLSRFEAELHIDSVERKYASENGVPFSIQEWFISGKIPVQFPRRTRWEKEQHYKKEREDIDKNETPVKRKSSSTSSNFLLIDLPSIKCIVAEVPKQFGPKWASRLCIEYRKEWGEFPDEDTRKAIALFVGFVFGNQLFKIGSTHYDDQFNTISQEYQSPWGGNILNKCKHPGFSPVKVDYHSSTNVETVFADLFPTYLVERKKLDLDGIIWKYWGARDATIGLNLPIYSSALESLGDAILKRHKEFNHYYMSEAEFHELIADELKSITGKLEGKEYKDIVLNKIRKATTRGANEKLNMMFEILKLNIGANEKEAIKARNKMAHSSKLETEMPEVMDSIKLTYSYMTLFHRVILKLLGYNGKYLDYFSDTHVERNINDAI